MKWVVQSVRPVAPSSPLPPFADWPVQLVLPAGYAWYTDPGVFVTQAHIEHSTFEDTAAMSLRIDDVLRLKKAEIAKHGGLLILHDWRKLKSWDDDARQHLIERSIRREKGEVRGIYIAISMNPLFHLMAHVANVTLSALGISRVKLVDSLDPVLEKHGVKKPNYARFPEDGTFAATR
jgi:hypothetical protein